jgi:hypothetical protein
MKKLYISLNYLNMEYLTLLKQLKMKHFVNLDKKAIIKVKD